MERNSINVIMELSYKTDGRKKLIFKEIAGDFFPTIFEVIPYEESEIDKMIKKVIDINTIHDKYNLNAIENNEN